MKFLICGLGSIGQRHYKNLLALGIIDILVYRTKKSANKKFVGAFEKEFRPRIFYDLDKALAEKPDAVLITNPTAFHIPIAIKAARTGVNIFTEKPLSHNMNGVARLLKEISKNKLIGYIGCNLRFHPLLQQMKKWMEADRIGKILSAHAEIGEYLPDWHLWEDYRKTYAARKNLGGGVILTQSHDIDYLYWFFGMPEYVSAFGGKKSDLEIDVDDLVETIFEFKSGVIASLHMDYLKRPPKRQFEILGTKGRMVWDYQDKTLSLLPLSKNEKPITINEPRNFERNVMFLAELRHFIGCVQKKEKPVSDLFQGKDVLKICLAIKKSLENKKIIKL